MSGAAADDFFADKTDDGEGVPKGAAGEGEIAVADGDFFAVGAPVPGVAQAADATNGEAERERCEARAGTVEAEVELVVGEERVGRIEGAVRGEEGAPVEGGLVVDEIPGARVGVGIERVDPSVGVGGFAGGDVGGGAGEQDRGEREDFGGGEAVVGTEEEDPLPTGEGDGAVHRVVNAGVGGAGKVRESRAVLLQPSDGAVGGGTVDDDDFGREVALRPDALEGLGEARAGVFTDQYDADRRR